MHRDRRVLHGVPLRVEAARLHDAGLGRREIARRIGVPHGTVRKWLLTYRARGMEGLMEPGGRQSRYDFETKVAAAKAVVEDGVPKPEAMERFGIASASPLDRWCRLYREGGAEALRPKPKGRPRREAAPMTREQELEREVGRLEAQVAYLKKSIALKAELGLLPGSGRRP